MYTQPSITISVSESTYKVPATLTDALMLHNLRRVRDTLRNYVTSLYFVTLLNLRVESGCDIMLLAVDDYKLSALRGGYDRLNRAVFLRVGCAALEVLGDLDELIDMLEAGDCCGASLNSAGMPGQHQGRQDRQAEILRLVRVVRHLWSRLHRLDLPRRDCEPGCV